MPARYDPGPLGGLRIGLGSRTLERAGRWLGPQDGLGALVCCRKACHKAERRVEEEGGTLTFISRPLRSR